MYRRIMLSSFLLLLVLTGCAVFQNVTPCAGIAIGILTGDEKSDAIAQEQRDGYDLALQEINAAGGINGCPLKLVSAQEPLAENANQTRQAVRTLIEDGRVIAILGGESSAATMQAATLVNYFEVPLLTPSASGSHILPDNNLWAFRLHASEDTYAQTVAEMIKQQAGTNKTVAILFEDTTQGHDAAVAAVKALDGQTLTVAAYLTLNFSAGVDSAALAQQVNAARPGFVYLIFNRPDQAARVFSALQSTPASPAPLYIAHAGGFASNAFLLNATPGQAPLPAAAEDKNVLIATQWVSPQDTPESGQFSQSFAAYTRQKYGQELSPTLYNSEAYKSLKILAIAARNVLVTGKATPDDTQKMRTQLREQLFVYQEDAPPWSKINFSAGGQSSGTVYLVKFTNQKLTIQYPRVSP